MPRNARVSRLTSQFCPVFRKERQKGGYKKFILSEFELRKWTGFVQRVCKHSCTEGGTCGYLIAYLAEGYLFHFLTSSVFPYHISYTYMHTFPYISIFWCQAVLLWVINRVYYLSLSPITEDLQSCLGKESSYRVHQTQYQPLTKQFVKQVTDHQLCYLFLFFF